MTAATWLRTAVGEERLRQTSTEVNRRRLTNALSSPSQATDDRDLQFVTNALELQLFDILDDEGRVDELRDVATETFRIARTLAWPEEPIAAAEWLVRLGCIAVLGDRSADFRRMSQNASFRRFRQIRPTGESESGRQSWTCGCVSCEKKVGTISMLFRGESSPFVKHSEPSNQHS